MKERAFEQLTEEQKSAVYGKRVFWSIIAFFCVMLAANGVFLYNALTTHSGVTTQNSYEKGLAYNEVVAAAQKQEALGWNKELAWRAPMLQFAISDKDNEPIEGAHVRAYFERPTQGGKDFSVRLIASQTQPGVYEAKVDFPLKGNWDAYVVSHVGDNEHQYRQRIMVP